MLRRMGLALAILGCGGRALADEPPEGVTEEIWPEPDSAVSGFVGLDAGTRTGAGVQVGGEAALTSGGGSELATGGALGAYTGESTFAATHWARATFQTLRVIDRTTEVDVTLFPAGLSHRLEWNAVPRLGARRLVWNAPYSSEELEGWLAMCSLVSGMVDGWNILPLEATFGGAWWYQALDDGARLRSSRAHMGAAMIAAREAEGDGEVVIFRGTFDDDIDRVELARLRRVPLGRSPLRLDASFGSAEVLEYDNAAGFRRTGGLIGDLGLWLDIGDVRVGARAGRDYDATIDDALIREDRAEATVAYVDDDLHATLTAFTARTLLLWTDGSGEIAYQPTFGADLDARWALRPNVEALLGGGWARSFYARGGDMLPAPTTGFEANAELRIHFDRR